MTLLLRVRDLRLLTLAVGLSAAGDFLLWVPMALHVEELSGSAFAVSAFFLALFAPVVLLGGVAGRLADRVENARLLVVVSLAQAVVAALMVVATADLAPLLVLTALLGAGAALSQPAEFALIPAAAAGSGRLAAANGLIESARYVGMTAGPLAGGVLAAAGQLHAALLLDAASFLAVAAAARALHARRHPEPRARHDSGRAREGLDALRRDPVLRTTLAGAVVALLFFSVTIVAEVLYVRDVLDAGPVAYGVLTACWTLGMVLSATHVAPRIPPGGLAAGALAGVALQGLGIAGAAAGGVLLGAFAGFGLGGIAHGVKNVLLRTLIHERVPAAVQGRAYAAYNAARNGAELVALGTAGVSIGLLGAQDALLTAGLVPLAVGLAGLVVLRRQGQSSSLRRSGVPWTTASSMSPIASPNTSPRRRAS